jgi:hypothetical protein
MMTPAAYFILGIVVGFVIGFYTFTEEDDDSDGPDDNDPKAGVKI